MILKKSKQRLYAGLLFLGAGILLTRTIIMLSEGTLEVLEWWVAALLIIELVIDLACMAASVKWFKANLKSEDSIPLRLGTAAAIVHAFRVLIFVVGRVGPWIDFDVRPEQRALQYTRWSWEGLYFAGIMAILGVLGVIVIWMLRRHSRNS